jgi:hypothetical protein
MRNVLCMQCCSFPVLVKRKNLLIMSRKAKPKSITDTIWDTLENPVISTKVLEEFSLSTEEKAVASFTTAFKNIKRRKHFDKVKHRVKIYEEIVKKVYFV